MKASTILWRLILFSVLWSCYFTGIAQNSHTISGYLRDATSGESLISAPVFDEKSGKGTLTNSFGFFSLSLPEDSIILRFSYAGFALERMPLMLNKDFNFNVDLKPYSLDEVEIVAEELDRAVDNTEMSAVSIPINQIKLMPALLGEVDVIKAVQLMPGVQSGSEGSTGLYVRGGGPDQNLILLDGVPLYYVSHLGGFFSVFNADALSTVKLYKGGFPARYGGRLSSVLDIRMKEGNMNEFEAEGSIGIISSKLSVQGPINKGKTSFIVSGRRTYIDLLTRPLSRIASEGEASVGYYFYDLNAKINHIFSDKDRLYLSMYSGDDRFSGKGGYSEPEYEEEFGLSLGWGNRVAALRWNHVWSNNLFSNVTATFSRYQLRTKADGEAIYREPDSTYSETFGLDYVSRIRDWGMKIDFDYYPSPNHEIKFGLQSTYHTFEPGTIGISQRTSESTLDTSIVTSLDRSLESAIYIEDNLKIGRSFSANLGVHAVHYLLNEKSYFSVQPRVSARYALSNDVSLKASYVHMNQYIHLLTNSGIGLPIDLWVPATENVPAQFSWQTAAGVSWALFNDKFEFSLEGYYKKMDGLITFKEGNNFFFGGVQGGTWEETVETGGVGETYGAELLLQKKQGKTTGWFGYTLSWNNRQFANVNGGLAYPYKYDRRHDLSLVVTHQFSDRISMAGTWVFGTGNAISFPTGGFATISDPLGGGNGFQGGFDPANGPAVWSPFRQIFTDIGSYGQGGQVFEEGRNSFRMQPYHRLDLGVNFTKPKKWGERTWSIGIYNAYSRLNPFAYYIDRRQIYDQNTGTFVRSETKLKKITLFPIIPSVSYQFKFK